MHVEQCRWEWRFVLNPNLIVSAFFASCWFRTACLAMRTCRLSESGHITAFKILESTARVSGGLAYHTYKILGSNNNKKPPKSTKNSTKPLFQTLHPLALLDGISEVVCFQLSLKSSQVLVWGKMEVLWHGFLLHAWASRKNVPFESRSPVAVSRYESAVQGLWSPKHTSPTRKHCSLTHL